jgi:hypothetical protein
MLRSNKGDKDVDNASIAIDRIRNGYSVIAILRIFP